MCGAAYGSTTDEVRRFLKGCELMLWGREDRATSQASDVLLCWGGSKRAVVSGAWCLVLGAEDSVLWPRYCPELASPARRLIEAGVGAGRDLCMRIWLRVRADKTMSHDDVL